MTAVFSLFLAACGSAGEAPQEEAVSIPEPALSQPVSKTVFLQGLSPEDLELPEASLQWRAFLKGRDGEGKALGALGPVAGSLKEENYQFVFAGVPAEFQEEALLSVQLLYIVFGVRTECQAVGEYTQTVLFEENRATAVFAPEDFDTANDCDGDGLPNLVEFLLGTDVDAKDTDGDGVDDLHDFYPLDPSRWAEEEEDDDPTGPVLVGAPEELEGAIAKAKAKGKDIYMAAGTYRVDDLVIPGGVRFYGGYASDFSEREPLSSDPRFATILTSGAADTTLHLKNLATEVLFDGFQITNNRLEKNPVVGGRTVVIDNAKVRLTNSTVTGSSVGKRTAAVAVLGDSHVLLSGNRLEGGAGDDASTALLINTADDVSAEDNVLLGGAGRFSTGLSLAGSSPAIRRNTIDSRSRFASPAAATSVAVWMQNALNVELSENIFVTGTAANQYGLVCSGLEPSESSGIFGNLFASFPLGSGIRSVSCLGDFDDTAGDGLEGFPFARDNIDYDQGDFGSLLEETIYHVQDARYAEKGASR